MIKSTRTLEEQVGHYLQQANHTLCTAESCTGGLIASRITDIAGSSAYFLGGIVSYSNTAKQHLLKVRQGTMMAYGAVSESTAIEMANGALEQFNATYALSVTGIAGPGGGTSEKPVGLTYIGLAQANNETIVNRFVWEGNRLENKLQSANAALQMLLDVLVAVNKSQ